MHRYGSTGVLIEAKYENRSNDPRRTTLGRFLQSYHHENMYIVSEVSLMSVGHLTVRRPPQHHRHTTPTAAAAVAAATTTETTTTNTTTISTTTITNTFQAQTQPTSQLLPQATAQQEPTHRQSTASACAFAI
jgi:hypothetical protein